ncbi:nuclear transport factor 2 family protein [Shimia ponticola]|uniref:nuclear transport factor 2 family protein n=1 Tax=Shimia ponticola TaxID=2582893 RepID=UPI0011BFDA9D|nr:nuclear transport factor 2 family protein [Shimia ponticola]
MPVVSEALRIGLEFIQRYNDCFYRKDLAGLQELYAADAFVGFWDNHPDCDAIDLSDHLDAVGAFFAKGKTTESGGVEPLIIEDARARRTGDGLIVTAMLRYASAPRPGVRSTFVLVRKVDVWQAAHIHHSFDPNE